ncbi:MAG: alpha/beta hydrolase [Bacillales bacterium]|jgi:acetyl esterase/lipase|nr:alpha/beta hydrolase [Bacillales bacterium]
MNVLKYLQLHKITENSLFNLKRGKFNYLPKHFPKTWKTVLDEIEERLVVTAAKDNKNKKHFIFFHGGAYVCEAEFIHTLFAKRLINTHDIRVSYIDYPLAPESNALNTVEVSFKVYLKLIKKYSNDEIYIMGDSAGGGLALVLLQKLRDNNLPLPKLTLLISPWVDLTMTNPAINTLKKVDLLLPEGGLRHSAKLYADKVPLTNPLVSPLFNNQDNLGNVFITVGSDELFYSDVLILLDEMNKTNTNARLSIGKGMFHDYLLIPLKESRKSLKELFDFVEELQ